MQQHARFSSKRSNLPKRQLLHRPLKKQRKDRNKDTVRDISEHPTITTFRKNSRDDVDQHIFTMLDNHQTITKIIIYISRATCRALAVPYKRHSDGLRHDEKPVSTELRIFRCTNPYRAARKSCAALNIMPAISHADHRPTLALFG